MKKQLPFYLLLICFISLQANAQNSLAPDVTQDELAKTYLDKLESHLFSSYVKNLKKNNSGYEINHDTGNFFIHLVNGTTVWFKDAEGDFSYVESNGEKYAENITTIENGRKILSRKVYDRSLRANMTCTSIVEYYLPIKQPEQSKTGIARCSAVCIGKKDDLVKKVKIYFNLDEIYTQPIESIMPKITVKYSHNGRRLDNL